MKNSLKSFGLLIVALISTNFQLLAQINGTSTVCAGQTETYSSVSSAVTYNWSANGASSVSQSGASFTVEWGAGGTGTVSLVTYNQSGVQTGTHNLPVTINAKPNPVILSSFSTVCSQTIDGPDSCFLACQFSPTVYTSPLTAGASYSWQIIGAGTMTTLAPNEIQVIWQTLGVHYIRLTVSNGVGCSNTYEKCVRVIEAPTAIIGTTPANASTITVCKGADIFLHDLSTGSIGRRWDFGDGNSSNKLSPTHSYSQAGTYEVILTANNACHCLNFDTITVVVNNTEGPEIICPAVVCEGDTVSYSTASTCSSFDWSVTNGTILGSDTGNTVDVVWTNHVGYIQLEGTSCNTTCNAPTIEKIAVLADSIPIQGANPVCIGSDHIYSITPIPGSVYIWTVATTLSTNVEVHEYYINVKDIIGSGAITVSYTNALLGCSGSSTLYVDAKERLNFAFPSEVCNNDSASYVVDHPIDWTIVDTNGIVVFTDTNVTEVVFNWNNFASGNYTLQLRKRNSYCNDLDFPFSILPAPDMPDSIYGSNSVCLAQAYSYHVDPRTGYIVEWLIEGGNPSIATGNAVTVNWNPSGPYVLRAAYRQLASPSCLSDYKVKTLASAINGTPTILAPDSVCGGDTAIFALNFIPDDVEWTVIPEKGASILTDRYTHQVNVQFSAALTQDIVLKAEGHVCGTFFSYNKTVHVKSFPAPTISFSDPNPCPGVPVRFSTSATNPYWIIDGQAYQTLNPIIAFDSAKSVIVRVAAVNTGPFGCQVTRVNIRTLTVANNPKAFFTVLDTNANGCADTTHTLTFTATSQGSGVGYSYQWTKDGSQIGTGSPFVFGPTNAFGQYSLEVTGPNGCISFSDNYKYDPCGNGGSCHSGYIDPDSVNIVITDINCTEFYIAQATFNGGQTVNSIELVKPDNVVSSLGNYPPYNKKYKLEAGNHKLRFDGTVVIGTDTFCYKKEITKNIPVAPDFSLRVESCANLGFVNYKIFNESTFIGSVPTYSWNFGAGVLVTAGTDPVVKFPAGAHMVQLSVSGSSCTYSKTINVVPSQGADFSSSAPVCQQEPVQYTNQSLGTIAEYKWKLGEKVLFDENPIVTYEDHTNRTGNLFPFVDLYILDESGCRDTLIQQDTIYGNDLATPLFPPLFAPICEGDSLMISTPPTYSPNNIPVSYSWSNQATTTAIYPKQTGNYKLSLTDNVGCRFVSQQVNIQVNTSPDPRIIGKQTFCKDEDIRLSTVNHPSYGNFEWFFNGTGTSQYGDKFKMGNLNVGTYQVSINAQNTSSGCPNVNSPFLVTVLAAVPKPSISASGSSLCEGLPITLSATGGSNYFWNTGQTGNSITQSLAGKYTVFQTDISGCQSSNFIDIYPLPDFSNFMEGCYCLPSVNPPDLPGIADMKNYQWIKNGALVPLPSGTMQNLPASEGRFELIASTDSGCVDTARYMDITIGGCEDCMLSLYDFEFSCVRTDIDTVFYDFTLLADIDNAPAFYNLNHNLTINGIPVLQFQVQPNSISGTRNSISGSFATVNSNIGDSLCIQLTAFNPAVNCSATLCTAIEPLACDFTPSFSYTINPYTCLLELTETAQYGSCTSNDSVLYSWTITQGSNVYTGTGDSISVDSLTAGNALVCMQMQVFNAADSSFCIKDTCMTIVVPDCTCKDDCSVGGSAYFERFIQQGNSCIVEFKIILFNPLSNFVSVNHIQTNSGQIISIVPTASAPNTVAFLVQFLPEDSSKCINQCFELFLNDGGTDCCVNICVDIPKCSCSLRLSELDISCAGAGSPNGYYDFKFLTDLTACDGFNYDVSQLTASLNGIPVPIVTYNPSTIVNGEQLIIGTVNLNGHSDDTLCFNITSSLGGIDCSETICAPVPEAPCEITPSFVSSFDPNTCILTLTNTTTIGTCTALDSSTFDWTVVFNGQTYTANGQTVQFNNFSDTDLIVCLEVSGYDYSGGTTCTVEHCETINVPPCVCEEPCTDVSVSSSKFVKFTQQGNSCILTLEVTIDNMLGTNFSLNTMFADKGDVLNTTLVGSINGTNTYSIDFYPNQPWNGGDVCFDAFLTLSNGIVCCVQFCINLPKCDCDFALNNLIIDCTGPNGTLGDFTFSFDTGFLGSIGFNYNSTLTATLNGSPVTIGSYQPTVITNGNQTVTGTISLPQGVPGDTLCFTITAELGGRTCTATICDTLPDDNCVIVPSFTWSIDPVTCDIIFTSTTTFGSCTYLQPNGISWNIYQGGTVYSGAGSPVTIPNIRSGAASVCLTVLGINYTNNQDCHPTVCFPIMIPACPEEEEEEEEGGWFRTKAKELQEADILTYPNPTKNTLFVEWREALDETIQLKLHDHQSKVVLTETRTIQGKKIELDLNNYAEGVYVLEISWKGQISRKKIVILK